MNIPKLVYISSAEVYGAAAVELVEETQPRRPRSPYGVAKASAEMFIESILAGSATSAAILRPFSIYGPGGDPEALVPTVMRQARSADRIELFDLQPIRDYCYVTDVAAAIVLAIHAELSGVTVLNLGSGEGLSVRSLAETALAVAGRTVPIVQSTSSDRPRASNIERLVADRRRALAVLGWQPRICLLEGLQQLYNELKDRND
jgi:nucleoside-diphosphate-sugar epimerase